MRPKNLVAKLIGMRIVHFCDIKCELREQLRQGEVLISGVGYSFVYWFRIEHCQCVMSICPVAVGCRLALPIMI
jgi:hypothetical protein